MTERKHRSAELAECAALKSKARAARDARILALAAEGLTQRQIARRIGVSDAVVSRVAGCLVTRRPGDRGLPHGVP